LIIVLKEIKRRVPECPVCISGTSLFLQLSHYAKSGRVDPDFVAWLRNSILVGNFSENERMLQGILGILDMCVALELTANEATMQLQRVLSHDACALCPSPLDFLKSTSCKTPFSSNVKDKDKSGDATCPLYSSCSVPYQTQLDAAGFKRQKLVRLMDGQASSCVV
jgi:hypothetical protein